MSKITTNEENFAVPPSTGKKKKARKVFGNILSNVDLNHSLSYSPSPFKGGKDLEGSHSPLKIREQALAINLFSIAESTEGRARPAARGKSDVSSSQQSSVCQSESSSVVVKPFSKILGSTSADENEDIGTLEVPKSIRVPSDKRSLESKLSLDGENFESTKPNHFYSKEERFAKTAKPYKPSTGLRPPTDRSVNRALNAARRARERALKEKVHAAVTVRGQWKEEKDEAFEFYEESEKLRRQQLILQNQLSSKFSRSKAQCNQTKRQAQREETLREAIFKSDVSREQRQKLKEMEDKRRRASIAVRARIRENNREGTEKLKLSKIEEEKAIHEERKALSQAFQQYEKDLHESARKNYQFKRGDALRIREMHNKLEHERKKQEQESYELMFEAARDVDNYRKELERQRRESLQSRNVQAWKQRQRDEKVRATQMQSEHESFELRRAADKDVENHRRHLEELRRASLEFRGKEARKHREILSGLDTEAKKASSDSYQLKFIADKDVEAYRQLEGQLRRKSLEQRGVSAREIREKILKDEANRREKEYESWELKFAGDKDVDEFRRKMEEERRQSLNQRNAEAKRQREEEDKRLALAAQSEHESYELKWDGERDAHEYLRQTEQERRNSLELRKLEARRQRNQANDIRSAQLLAEHEGFELKRAADKDVDEFRMKEEQERRAILAFRNKEKVRHAKVMEELAAIAKDQESESYSLKWGGEDDAKAYQAKLEEERRKSIHFRNVEAKRQREIDEENQRQALEQKHKDEKLRTAAHKDVENYRRQCAERERASLEYRGKEIVIHRLEQMTALQKEFEAEDRNHQLDSLARIDVQEYIKSCKHQRRKSLALRAKEKRKHAEWVRREEQRQLEQRSNDSRLRARDYRSMELARQKERTAKALEALRHASCTFSSFPIPK